MTPEAMAQACAAAMWAKDEASRGLGMVLEHVAPGRSRISMPVRPGMLNGAGLCHGYVFTFANSERRLKA